MDTKNLHEKVPCRRCGNMKLRLSSVCPYCGDLKEETWWDRLKDTLSGKTSAEGEGPGIAAFLPVIIALVIAGFVVYQALTKGSYENLVAAAIVLFLALRAWFARRSGAQKKPAPSSPGSEETDNTMSEGVGTYYSCENCGAKVEENDEECSHCGMRFGS